MENAKQAKYTPPPSGSKRMLRLPEVISRTGYGRASIYAMMSEGKFPPAVHLGARAVAWVESEIEDWINQRIAASRQSCS